MLAGATPDDAAVADWLANGEEPRRLAGEWLAKVKACGSDVEELLHDGHPTACVAGAAFAYVDAFTAHASIGFFHGASLPDPSRLLEGSGKRIRHVKLHWGRPVDATALEALIAAAYDDIRRRLA